MSLSQDIAALIRGLEKVARAAGQQQSKELARKWQNSSIRSAALDTQNKVEDKLNSSVIQQSDVPLKETFSNIAAGASDVVNKIQGKEAPNPSKEVKNELTNTSPSFATADFADFSDEFLTKAAIASAEFDAEVKKLAEDLKAKETSSSASGNNIQSSSTVNMTGLGTSMSNGNGPSSYQTQQTKSFHYDSAVDVVTEEDLKKAEEKASKLKPKMPEKPKETLAQKASKEFTAGIPGSKPKFVGINIANLPKQKPKHMGAKPLGSKSSIGSLGAQSKERKVPGTRIGRVVSFGQLAAGLGVGTIAEMSRRAFGLNEKGKSEGSMAILDNSAFLTEANAERIVNTLCRVRGAALKLGQMISIQDNSMLNPQLQKIFERVRQSADFMPPNQMQKQMNRELGSDWRERLAEFDDKPFAAASIGQVHRGTLHDGREVAMKIQYPGVAESIDSDINNLMSVMSVAKIFPEGLYADQAIDVARRELRNECDYHREADSGERFRELLKDDAIFYVPEVIRDLTTERVLTTELVKGISLEKVQELDQETKDYIGTHILRLCLTELFVFNFMQTDPNWSNFLYDQDTGRISLLDFGASRDFSKKFTDEYIKVIHAATLGDRDGIVQGSINLGFLTGYETKVMESAHTDAVLILGEAFASKKPFNFGTQTTSSRIHSLIPVMLNHRLTPPPEETYSLHRKMAGCFLLCNKLGATVDCGPMFEQIWKNYKFASDEDVKDADMAAV